MPDDFHHDALLELDYSFIKCCYKISLAHLLIKSNSNDNLELEQTQNQAK